MTTPVNSAAIAPAAVPQSSTAQSEVQKRALMQQRRETMMIDKLVRDAQPPKNRMDAITRSAFDSVGFDTGISLVFTAGLAAYKGLFNKGKSWKWVLGWGLGIIPASMLIRAVSAAFTGKAHGQEASQRILDSMGMGTANSPANQAGASVISSPLVSNTQPQVPQTLVKPQSALSVSG